MSTEYRVQSIEFRVQSTEYRVEGRGCRVQSTEVKGTEFGYREYSRVQSTE